MNPLVGLTTTTVIPEGSNASRQEIALYALYVSVLDQVGLTPVLITPAHSARSIHDLLENCSGLVLSGGEDVHPARYGEEPVLQIGRVNAARDEMEFAALAVAFERNIPILGICRGCQVLNVYMGGSLFQDIDTQQPGELTHRQSEPWNSRTHNAKIAGGSHLARIVGEKQLCINSFHHQAVKDVAPGLRVTAYAEDGLIEAVEANDHPWVIGVQWHPERHEATAPETDPDRLLFNDFRRVVFEHAVLHAGQQ